MVPVPVVVVVEQLVEVVADVGSNSFDQLLAFPRISFVSRVVGRMNSTLQF